MEVKLPEQEDNSQLGGMQWQPATRFTDYIAPAI